MIDVLDEISPVVIRVPEIVDGERGRGRRIAGEAFLSSSLRHLFNETEAVVLLTYRGRGIGRRRGGEGRNRIGCVNVEISVGEFCQD